MLRAEKIHCGASSSSHHFTDEEIKQFAQGHKPAMDRAQTRPPKAGRKERWVVSSGKHSPWETVPGVLNGADTAEHHIFRIPFLELS